MPTSTRKSKKSAKVVPTAARPRVRVPQPQRPPPHAERQRYIENLRNQIRGREEELRQCKEELRQCKEELRRCFLSLHDELRQGNIKLAALREENMILRRRLQHLAPGAARSGSPHGGGRRTYRRRRGRRRRRSRRSVPG